VEVTSSHDKAPKGLYSYSYDGNTYSIPAAFYEMTGNGSDGLEITGMQDVGDEYGYQVVQGIGQTSGSDGNFSWTQTNVGVEIASGTYSGSGTLSVNVSSTGFIQTLNDVSGSSWSGPGNVSIAEVTGDTIDVSS